VFKISFLATVQRSKIFTLCNMCEWTLLTAQHPRMHLDRFSRFDYKIALMTYSCVHGTSPAYFHGICRPVASVDSRAMLRSANYGELVKPRTRGKRYGPRSFRVAAPIVWNNLPRHLRKDDISREQFARDLKTVLFSLAYSSDAPLRTSV